MKERKFELIKKGFDYLNKDCVYVALDGFVGKDDIPEKATREEFNEGFDHEYHDVKSDGYDDGSFFGYIYIPFVDGEYLRFNVNS